MIGVVWKGRAGQGIVTNANLLGSAAIESGLQAKSFPSFGGERIGAPVNSFTYLDDHRIHLHCIITKADVVSIVDPYFVHNLNLFNLLRPGGLIVINCADSYTDAEITEAMIRAFDRDEAQPSSKLPVHSGIYRIDAQARASKFFQRGQGQNIVILGATFRVMQTVLERFASKISEAELVQQIDKTFRKKIGTQKTIDNQTLFQEGYAEIRPLDTEGRL